MIQRFSAGRRHRRRTASSGHLGAAVWILGFRRLSRNTFAPDCDENCRIVWLIRDRTRFAILNPKIRPVIIDLESERSSVDLDIAPKILRDIEAVFFSA